MLKISIELENGTIYVDDEPLNLQSEKTFKYQLSSNTQEQLAFLEYNNHHSYCIDGEFLDKKFMVSVTFFEGRLYYNNVTLRPAWGHAFTKGYDTSHKEIMKDIKNLSQLLEKKLNITSSLSVSNKVFYKFEWGEIVCSGSLKTPSASISIRYIK